MSSPTPLNTLPSPFPIMNDVAITNFQHLIKKQGYLYLEELPENFDHLAFVESFGTLIPHKYNREYVFSIKVEPKQKERYPAFTKSEVEPHTENYEYEHVPLHYQCLWCVMAKCGGGHTLLAHGYAFINSL